MGVFDSGEYVDYTLLKKRGLLKMHENVSASESRINNSSGFVDFTAGMSNNSSSNNSAGSASSPFDLLSNLTSGSNSAGSTNGSYYGGGSSSTSSSSSEDVNALKLKIEDLEYKIQMLIERMDKMNSSGK